MKHCCCCEYIRVLLRGVNLPGKASLYCCCAWGVNPQIRNEYGFLNKATAFFPYVMMMMMLMMMMMMMMMRRRMMMISL